MLEIDEKATIKNTRKFFEKDLERYQTMCAGRFNVHGMNLENIKVNSSADTSAITNRYNLIIVYNDRLACLNLALDNCTNEPTKPYKRIIELKYIKGLTSSNTANRLGYGSTQFNVLRKQALLQFADIYLVEQLKRGVKDILDLHAYKGV